jgi:DHA1 family multidrug resistance protein-like MFS transporter
VRPRPQGTPDAQPSRAQVTFRSVLAFQNFLLLMGVVFGLQFVDRSFGPVLPLYIAASGVAPSRVALVSGVLFSLAAGAGAAGNYFCERLMRWLSARATIVSGASVAALAALVFAAFPVTPALLVASVLFGAGIGVATTAAYTSAGSVIPEVVRGTGFGVLTSAWLAGMALSPIVNGLLGATSIRAVFVLDVVGLLILAGVVWRAMVDRAPARA